MLSKHWTFTTQFHNNHYCNSKFSSMCYYFRLNLAWMPHGPTTTRQEGPHEPRPCVPASWASGPDPPHVCMIHAWTYWHWRGTTLWRLYTGARACFHYCGQKLQVWPKSLLPYIVLIVVFDYRVVIISHPPSISAHCRELI